MTELLAGSQFRSHGRIESALVHGHTATSTGSVPFVDLSLAAPLRDDLLRSIGALLDTSAFTNGAQVLEFERAFADYCGAMHCVGTGSGLDALRLALLGAGIQPGDEVVVPALTFVATYEAVSQAGGMPRVVDISMSDWNIDPAGARAAIGQRTRFLMPVHLYGQMADVRTLAELGTPLVEDACQAHGAGREGIRAGAAGLAAAFSFYPTKNLGAAGDAGALVTNDQKLANRVRALRQHGEVEKYRSVEPGYTARLDTLQAIVLLAKLPFLDAWNAARAAAARFYDEALAGVGDLRLPPVPAASQPAWHLYVVRTDDPTGLALQLAERGIGTGRHYPEPPHLSEAYSWLGHREGEFPVAEAIAREALSLPLFPGITQRQLETTATAVRSYFDRA